MRRLLLRGIVVVTACWAALGGSSVVSQPAAHLSPPPGDRHAADDAERALTGHVYLVDMDLERTLFESRERWRDGWLSTFTAALEEAGRSSFDVKGVNVGETAGSICTAGAWSSCDEVILQPTVENDKLRWVSMVMGVQDLYHVDDHHISCGGAADNEMDWMRCWEHHDDLVEWINETHHQLAPHGGDGDATAPLESTQDRVLNGHR